MKKGDRIVLKSFLGKLKPLNSFNENENYWKLIGTFGTVVEVDNIDFKNRVLIFFDENLDEMRLENHNPIKNTLWIRETDLNYLKIRRNIY